MNYKRLTFHGRGDEGNKRYDLVLMNPLTNVDSYDDPDSWILVFRTSEVRIKDHVDLTPTRVEIEIHHSRDIPFFYNSESYGSIFESGKFIYNGGELRINKSVVIKEVADEYQTRYFACLENQMCYRNDTDSGYIRDLNILIGSSNKNIHNMRNYEYSPLFQTAIDLQVAKDNNESFMQTAYNLEKLIHNEKNDENKQLLESTLVLVNQEKERLDFLEEKIFQSYLTHLRNLDNR